MWCKKAFIALSTNNQKDYRYGSKTAIKENKCFLTILSEWMQPSEKAVLIFCIFFNEIIDDIGRRSAEIVTRYCKF